MLRPAPLWCKQATPRRHKGKEDSTSLPTGNHLFCVTFGTLKYSQCTRPVLLSIRPNGAAVQSNSTRNQQKKEGFHTTQWRSCAIKQHKKSTKKKKVFSVALQKSSKGVCRKFALSMKVTSTKQTLIAPCRTFDPARHTNTHH